METEVAEEYERTSTSGQPVLHDFEAIMGYESARLKKPRFERFCEAFVSNGGYAGKAYLTAVNPKTSELNAQKRAHDLLKTPEIRGRIKEMSAVVRNRAMNELIDYRLRALKFDPAKYTGKSGAVRIDTVPECDRIGVGLEARIVDGCMHYLPVFPSPEKSADALQKIMGMDKTKAELALPEGGLDITLTFKSPDAKA